MSLSGSLGGLRIANPDADSESPSPPPAAVRDTDPSSSSSQRPPSSSQSSSSTITDIQKAHTLPQVGSQDPSSLGSLGFNPDEYSSQSNSASQLNPQPLSTNAHPSIPELVQEQSLPNSHPVQPPQALYTAEASNPGRAYGSPSNPSTRPYSAMYNHPNLSSSSAASVQGSNYRYRDDAFSSTPGTGVISRSVSSRVAPVSHPGFPTRESSRRDRSYPPVQNMAGNGLPPPRRSSRRVPGEPGMGSRAPVGMSPYGLEGGPLSSSEEWKEKGAAISVRQDVDANGKPIQRVVKKGVKDFNFGRTLGEGSYSTVLSATDRQTGREYAIKVLDKRHIIKEKKVKYVNIEKDTLNRLTEHPGIVRLYYTFQDERSLYFVLDLATGGELLGFLKKTATFDEECTRFYGAQILDAIEYMHSRGIIHRDLKPENVLLDDQMHVKITDFGTAKILDIRRTANGGDGFISGDPLDGFESDRAMSFVGTAEYVSPELLTDKNACKASDLWAFGCIIYQLLAGRPPFKAANEYQTFQKIVGLEYTFPDGFPAIARDLVERLLVLDPAKRLPIEHIKNHQFFDGIKWGKGLWKQKAPRLKSYVPPPSEPIRLNASSSVHGLSGNSNNQPRAPAPSRLITELPPPSQLDIDWSPVLTKNNERILKLGNLVVTTAPGPHQNGKGPEGDTPKKFSRFFGGATTKKRQRLVMVTSSARIILAAAGGDEKKTKMEISLLAANTSWKSFQDSKGLTCWCVDSRDKHVIFEDPKATTSDPDGSKYSSQEWMDIIERARDMAISQSITGDSFNNDINSTIPSPSTSLGSNSQLEGVNIPRNRHLRKDPDDTESLKGRKRFSKRHSKNGLAAVF